jgi:hypothetical protein
VAKLALVCSKAKTTKALHALLVWEMFEHDFAHHTSPLHLLMSLAQIDRSNGSSRSQAQSEERNRAIRAVLKREAQLPKRVSIS